MVLENLREAIEMVQEHVIEDWDICSTDQERIEWIVDLTEEFFNEKISIEVAADLLSLARR